MNLAAHLCGGRVREVLDGDDTFISTLPALGFKRVQINATAKNDVDTSNLASSVTSLALLMARHTEIEFILQKNQETRLLWEGILQSDGEIFAQSGKLPPNVTLILDESMGTGKLRSSWPPPPREYNVGYAGGIGPTNIKDVINKLTEISGGFPIWIDMESSLRSIKNEKDVFDLEKCYECIDELCASKVFSHPSFLV